MKSTAELIEYINRFINTQYAKRRLTVSEVFGSEVKYVARIDRDDFGSWSADIGYSFKNEDELRGFLQGYVAFYDSVSHTERSKK